MGSRLTVLVVAVVLSVAFVGIVVKASPAQTATKEAAEAGTQTGGPREPLNAIGYCGPSYTANSAYMRVSVQVNQRSGNLQWGVYMRDSSKNNGPWRISVQLNGKQVDFKRQSYPAHGSLRASTYDSRFNDPVFHVDVWHRDEDTGRTYSEPSNACVWGLI